MSVSDEQEMPPSVVCITNMIEPYRVPLFNYLHDDDSIEFTVVALSKVEGNRQWRLDEDDLRFEYTILPGVHRFDQQNFFPVHLNWGLWSTLRDLDPDFVVNTGYVTVANWLSLLYCRVHDAKPVLWNGTTLTSTSRSRARGGEKAIKEGSALSTTWEQAVTWLKRRFVSESDHFLTYGTEAAEYVEFLGAPSSEIEPITNSVDMEWFREQYREWATDESLERTRSAYPDILFLYVGRLVAFKGVQQLLHALARIDDEDVGLLVVGSGADEQTFQDLAANLDLSNVYFEGYQQREKLPRYYALADVFVFPTFVDPWGLVINEALASGLYVLASELAGATRDLIDEPWNGRTFDPSDVDEIETRVRETVDEIEEIRARRSEISRRSTELYDIRHGAKVFMRAITTWGQE